MDKVQVLEILRGQADALRAAGVSHMRIFGSVARDEATASSDVDLLADFNPEAHLSLVSIGALQVDLSELLGTEVDISSAEWMREPMRSRVLAEAVLVF
jgi:predicted nucleotidyltransferase